jgi:hypothetical protein
MRGMRAWVPSSGADPTRGGAQLSSGADPTRGGAQPSSEADLARGAGWALERGGPRQRGRESLERGRPGPRKRLSLERGEPHSRGVRCVVPAGRGGHRGHGYAVYAFQVCELICVLRFFQVLSGFPLGYLGDP